MNNNSRWNTLKVTTLLLVILASSAAGLTAMAKPGGGNGKGNNKGALEAATMADGAAPAGVAYIGEDASTGGAWHLNGYGGYAHILPGAPGNRLETPFGWFTIVEEGVGTPGYWKNHPEDWPVEYITIGSRTYSIAEAIAVMEVGGAGDKTYDMFDQLISALLSIYKGTPFDMVNPEVWEANAWMKIYPPGSGVGAGDPEWAPVADAFVLLSDYNRGDLGIPHVTDLTDTGTKFWETWTVEEKLNFFNSPPYYWELWQVLAMDYYVLDAPYYDEYVGSPDGSNNVTYSIQGTRTTTPLGRMIQYPSFCFAWGGWHDEATSQREVYYTNLNDGGEGWRHMTWDDGGERCMPLNGYFNVTLTFPEGTWRMALYAYDYERAPAKTWLAREQQTYRIYDMNGNQLVEDVTISGETFDNGVYENYEVTAPTGGLTLTLQVYNSGGHYSQADYSNGEFPDTHTINVVLSGIFIDQL